MDRRRFVQNTLGGAAALAMARLGRASDAADLALIQAQIDKQHDNSIQRLQDWIRQPSIAAENRGMTEGCDPHDASAHGCGLCQRHESSDRTDIRASSRRSMRARQKRTASTSCMT